MHDNGAPPVIRIVKKKGHHDGHHGGAWKVAYADFVTAMMAFFLVMWVVGMDQPAKDVVQAYFNNPLGYREQAGAGTSAALAGSTGLPTTTQSALFEMLQRRHREERARLEETAEHLRNDLSEVMERQGLAGAIDVQVGDDGLRIELAESDDGPTFFSLGSAQLTDPAQAVLEVVARELAEQPNGIIVEGHTDARPLSQSGYTNWELSNDRANAARRALEGAGLDPRRVNEVRGYADRKLRIASQPEDPANRRVTIFLPFLYAAPQPPTP